MPKVLGTIEGFWDCPYCGTKKIGGLKQACPNCGRVRDKDTKFYSDHNRNYLDETKVEKGPDWLCAYCNSYNKSFVTVCTNCGHARDEDDKNYFEQREHIDETQEVSTDADKEVDEVPSSSTNDKRSVFSKLGITAIIVAVIAMIVGFLIPKTQDITVLSKSWERSVQIEEYKLVEESDWSVPPDAVEVLSEKQEIHHYNQVLDHYERVQKSREVFDGYDTYTYEVDNGNGTFSVVENQTPRYRTEYYYEDEPVYRSDPVYQTKYYYTIWDWVYKKTETSKGSNEPYWPELNLGKNEREGQRSETYSVYVKNKKKEKDYNCNYDIWEKLEVDKNYTVKTHGNSIIEVVE